MSNGNNDKLSQAQSSIVVNNIRFGTQFSQPTNPLQDHNENTMRTYATRLARAALRKLTESDPIDNNRIDLTSERNKCTNSLTNNRIGKVEVTTK